jgi:type VI secretion system protein ImpK
MPRLERPPPPPVQVARPPPPRLLPPPPSQVVASLHRFLQPEIDAKLVIVSETPQMIEVRIFNRGMFALGSATVRPDFVSLLERIGEALNEEPGAVLVTGHTDNLPIHTVQFPSNFQLSVARAQAASAVMLHRLHDPKRLTVEGRADSQPIAGNDTEDGRAQNRRIDVILQRRS